MLELIGLVAGVMLGILYPLRISAAMTLYAGIGLLAALDSGVGGYRARLQGEFHTGIFLSGILGNAAIAVFLTWLGQKMGIPIYLAAVVVFGTRLFQNFGEIRRELLTSGPKKGKIKQDIENTGEHSTR